MKTFITILSRVVLLGSLVACNVPPTTQVSPTIQVLPITQGKLDFNFYFEYGACLVETFDTANGIFSHGMGPSEAPVLVSLNLTDEQLTIIYEKMVSIDFFNYPEFFVSTPMNSDETGIVTPATHYYLRVKNGDTEKAVSWTDEVIGPVTPETDMLRELFQLIITTLEGYPEIKELPMPLVGCL